jgi:hypothetical protein
MAECEINDLELCKAFAALEGVKVHIDTVMIVQTWVRDDSSEPYNPITDLALNCAARDKYKVSIVYYTEHDCGIDGNGDYDVPCCNINIGEDYKVIFNVYEALIPRAVIECILKK